MKNVSKKKIELVKRKLSPLSVEKLMTVKGGNPTAPGLTIGALIID